MTQGLAREDTVAAIATAPGRAALAIVRLTGPRAHEIARRVLVPFPEQPRIVTRCTAVDPGGRSLDDVIVTRFDAPRSFTGEAMVEITTHGGPSVPRSVLAALLEAGARAADPGEFTRRAVLAGKLDLLQAEAVGDLTDARTRGAQMLALEQLDGGLSRRLLALREDVLGIEALLAYDIDFPEEDDGPVVPERVASALTRVVASLDALLAGARTGELMREGALVVIAGPPNAGKSALFNALLGRERALVTDMPGTTRDAIEAMVDAEPWPLRLVDTAGIRSTEDVVERLGIEVSERYLADADVVVACAEEPLALEAAVAACASRTDAPVVAALTKLDLHGDEPGVVRPAGATALVAVSAERGDGLQELVVEVERAVSLRGGWSPGGDPLLTRARHVAAVRAAREELQRFRAAWGDQRLPAVVAAVHLRHASHELEELIGAVDVEQVLDRVFSTFCIGK